MTNPPPPGTSPYAAAQQGPPRMGNALGRVALILALVAVVVGLVQQVLGTFLPVLSYDMGLPSATTGALLSVFAVLRLLVSAAALVLGLIAASRRGLPQLTSGIAIGV